jgi:hypothetical protein
MRTPISHGLTMPKNRYARRRFSRNSGITRVEMLNLEKDCVMIRKDPDEATRPKCVLQSLELDSGTAKTPKIRSFDIAKDEKQKENTLQIDFSAAF